MFKCGALFSGIGGFCLGFESHGMPTAWAIEYDKHAVETYKQNLPNVRVIDKDIKLVNVVADALEPVDILHAGFPCQSFSQAGDREGFNDPRGMLFFEIIRLIEEFKDKKPKILVFENSPFLRQGEGGAWFLEVKNAIKKAGYWFRDENSHELNTYDFTDLPQQRNRLFMVAFNTDYFLSGKFEFPTEKNLNPKRLADFVEFDGEVDSSYYMNNENKYFQMITGAVTDKQCLYQLRKYQVRPKEPNVCPTLTANMGLGGHNVPFIMNGKGLRKLTEYECLHLQGFPKEYRFPDIVPRAKRYMQVGNAVAAPIAKLLAAKVREKLDREGIQAWDQQ